jgi:hypothetical protein
MGSDVAEAQIDDLSDAEIDVLLEIYEVLRLTPGNGRQLHPTGNMYVWDYKGISVTYVLLDPQREVAVLRVDASLPEIAHHSPVTPHHGRLDLRIPSTTRQPSTGGLGRVQETRGRPRRSGPGARPGPPGSS